MKIQVETLSPVEKQVSVEVDPEQVAKELERAYVSLGRRVKLRGFRPGKVPRQVLERQFRDEVEKDVVERLVSTSFSEAVKSESIPAVSAPRVKLEDGGLAQGKPLKYTARVEVKPKLEPRDYKGLQVTRRPPEVTDQMISDELTRIQDSMAQLVPVEGRFDAQEGDYAVIDHQGTVDGMPFEGSTAEGVTVRVLPGDMQEGHVEALKGKKLGETIELEQAFPPDHRVAEVRGKTARFTLTLKALKHRQVPALDDDLAKDVGLEGIDTLDKLRARLREDMERREQRRADGELKDALIKAALAKNDFEVPESLVERAIDVMLEGATERFARQGIELRQLGLDLPKLRADLRDQALLQVKGALLLEAIADTESIQVTDEDLQAEMARMASEVGVPLAKVQAQMKGGDARRALMNRVREEKALSFLTQNASVS